MARDQSKQLAFMSKVRAARAASGVSAADSAGLEAKSNGGDVEVTVRKKDGSKVKKKVKPNGAAENG